MPAMSDSPKFMGSELSSQLFWDQALPEYGFAMDRAIAPRPFELDELLRALCIPKARRRPSGVIIAGDNPAVERTSVGARSEEHTSELQSLMRISYAGFCLKKKKTQ